MRRPPGAPRPRRPRGTRCRIPPVRVRATGSGTTWRTRRPPRSGTGSPESETPPSSRTGAPYSAILPARRSESRPRPAMATVRSGTSVRSRTAASMRTSMPFRGTSRLTLTTSGPVGREPETRHGPRPARPARAVGTGARSTPEGISTIGGIRCPAAQGPAGVGRRVAAGRHGQGAVAAGRGRPAGGPGQASGDGDLGTVEHHGVGDPEPGTDETEGEDRIEDDQVGVDPSGRVSDAPDQRWSGDEHAGSRPARCGRPGAACSRSKAPGSGWELAVSTANESGSSRRHSSQR